MALVGCREACPAVEADAPEPGQNVLLVVFDDVSADQLALYGQTEGPMIELPTLDCLADQGLVFDTAWAEPSCSPARAALVTGQHPRRFGMGKHINRAKDDGEVPVEAPNLARVLAEAGYRSAHFGKWHLAAPDGPHGYRHPNALGWEHFAGSFGNLAREDGQDGEGSYDEWEKVVDGEVETTRAYPTRDTARDAARWIREVDEPWFVTVSFNAPHKPFHAAPRGLAGEKVDDGASRHDRYRSMLEAADDQLGWLLGRIDRDVLARTTVVVVGDNGTPWKPRRGPGRRQGKGSVYEGGLWVPMVVVGPPVAVPGSRTDALVSFVDLLPTVAELVGVPVPDGVDGMSFAEVLAEPGGSGPRELAFAEFFGPNGVAPEEANVWRAAVRGPRFKLVVDRPSGGSDVSEALFDLASGGERRADDLLAAGEDGLSDEAAGALARMRAELVRIREEVPTPGG